MMIIDKQTLHGIITIKKLITIRKQHSYIANYMSIGI